MTHNNIPTTGGWLTKRLRSEFLAFLVIGGFCAGVNIGMRFVLNLWMSYYPAIFLAYLCGMVTAFVLTRSLVFANAQSGARHHQFVRFTLVNVVAVLQVLLISYLLAEHLFPLIGFSFYPHDVAHITGVIVPAISSYFGHKYFSFKAAANP